MTKKRIALIRGPHFNDWESKNYIALRNQFEVSYILSRKNFFNFSDVDINIDKVSSLSDFYFYLPAYLKKLFLIGSNRIVGVDNYCFKLKRKLINYDIVHVPDITNIYAYQAAKFKEFSNIRLVTSCYENIPFYNHKSLLGPKVQKIVIPKIDKFHAVTERAKQVLLLYGVPEDKIFVQPFGIDIELFSPGHKNKSLAEKYNIQINESKVILYVGQVIRQKGVYTLLYAFNHLLKTRSSKECKLQLVIIGQGSEFNSLIMLAKELSISDNVFLMGSIPYNELPDFYRLSDIFILPSIPRDVWQEQFGFVLLEAMASGIPIVASLSGSIPEVVGDAGVLVQSYDHIALAQALSELLNNKNRRTVLSSKARKRALSLYDYKKVSEKLIQLFLL